MVTDESQPRTWLFWVLPPVLCGLAMALHCVLHVPTGEYELREDPSAPKSKAKSKAKSRAKAKPEHAPAKTP